MINMKVSTLLDFFSTLPPDFDVHILWKEEQTTFKTDGFQINYDASGKATAITINVEVA